MSSDEGRSTDDRVMMVGGDGAVAWVDPLTGAVSAGVAVANFGHRLIHDRRAVVDPRRPLFVYVTLSGFGNDRHDVHLQFHNRGDHGCYVETLRLVEPAGVELEVASAGQGTAASELGFSGSISRERPALPLHVPSEARVSLRVRIPRLTDRHLGGTLGGIMEFRYTVAGLRANPAVQQIEFAVRFDS